MPSRNIASSLRELARRDAADRRLLVSASLALLGCRAALDRVRLVRLARLTGQVPARRRPRETPARIAWAVRAVGRRLLGDSSCLPQALAARYLLARHGYTSRLRMGMAHDAMGRMVGHAWIEADGRAYLQDDILELVEIPLDDMEEFGGTWA
jgi:hypothetical protein